jgi:hypothetical protein
MTPIKPEEEWLPTAPAAQPSAMRIVLDRFRLNSVGYFRDFRVPLCLIVMASVLDGISTMYFMAAEGADSEVHPVVRLVSQFFGPVAGPVLGKACQLLAVLLVTVYFRRQAKYIFLAVVLLYAWAAWYNVWGRDLYVPRLLNW